MTNRVTIMKVSHFFRVNNLLTAVLITVLLQGCGGGSSSFTKSFLEKVKAQHNNNAFHVAVINANTISLDINDDDNNDVSCSISNTLQPKFNVAFSESAIDGSHRMVIESDAGAFIDNTKHNIVCQILGETPVVTNVIAEALNGETFTNLDYIIVQASAKAGSAPNTNNDDLLTKTDANNSLGTILYNGINVAIANKSTDANGVLTADLSFTDGNTTGSVEVTPEGHVKITIGISGNGGEVGQGF